MLYVSIFFILIVVHGKNIIDSTVLFHITANGTYEMTDRGKTIDEKLSKIASVLPAYNILKSNIIQSRFTNKNITPGCVNETIDLLLKINNQSEFSDVASSGFVRMLDAWAKPPERIFLGNSMWIGAYDECVDFQDAKYCSTPIIIQSNPLRGQYGSCFPKQCTSNDVSKVINVVVEELTLGLVKTMEECETFCESPVGYSNGVVASAAVLALIALLCLIGTAIEVFHLYFVCDSYLSCYTKQDTVPANSKSMETTEKEQAVKRATKTQHIDQKLRNLSFEEASNTRRNYSEETMCESVSGDEVFVVTNTAAVNELRQKSGIHEAAVGIGGIVINGSAPDADGRNVIDKTTVIGPYQKSSVSALVESQSRQTNVHNICSSILMCFSLIRNSKAIFSTNIPSGAITSINGIRVISMTWVIIGHFYQHNIMGGNPDNISGVRKSSHRFSVQPILNAFVCVDTFFLISGLLVTYISMRKVGEQGFTFVSIIMMYVHRFVRLTPSLAIVIIFWTNLYPILLSGPRGVLVTQTDTHAQKCWDYWWSVVFYFNNFYPDHNKGCLEWSWYLANDTQFYIVSPLILTLIITIQQKSKKSESKKILITFTFLLLLCLVSMVITGVITGHYDIPGLVSRNMISATPRANQAKWIVDRLYIKPYVRVTPFIVGVFLGYLLNKSITLKAKWWKLIVTFGWSISIIVALLVVVGPWEVYREDPNFFNDVENVMYSATHRFLWSCSVAWLIYACHNKYGGRVNKFLSAKVWLPLSRLTYGAYLIHMIVMYYFMNVLEIPNHYQNSLVISQIISIIVITHGLAFVLAICVEYPVLNLEKIFFEK